MKTLEAMTGNLFGDHEIKYIGKSMGFISENPPALIINKKDEDPVLWKEKTDPMIVQPDEKGENSMRYILSSSVRNS